MRPHLSGPLEYCVPEPRTSMQTQPGCWQGCVYAEWMGSEAPKRGWYYEWPWCGEVRIELYECAAERCGIVRESQVVAGDHTQLRHVELSARDPGQELCTETL